MKHVYILIFKIDKSKIVTGKKGKYLNLTVGGNRDGEDQYGNTHYIFQSQSKEEREAKAGKTYLGNVKVVWTNGDNVEPAPRDAAGAPPQPKQAPVPDEVEDLPF